MDQNKKILLIVLYTLPALTTPFLAFRTPVPVKIFPNIEVPKVLNNIPRNPLSCVLISCFTLVLTPINMPEFFKDFFYDSNNIMHIFI